MILPPSIYAIISVFVTLSSFPVPTMLSNSSIEIPSVAAIFLTKGEKNLPVEEIFSIVVTSITASTSFSIILVSSVFPILVLPSESELSESVSIIAIVSPTLTTASTSNNISTKVPSTSLGTSESTLSVAISTIASSSSMLSPIFFNQDVIVASATLSPILGSFTSNIAMNF